MVLDKDSRFGMSPPRLRGLRSLGSKRSRSMSETTTRESQGYFRGRKPTPPNAPAKPSPSTPPAHARSPAHLPPPTSAPATALRTQPPLPPATASWLVVSSRTNLCVGLPPFWEGKREGQEKPSGKRRGTPGQLLDLSNRILDFD
jgi:hypothetical protein